MKRIRTRVAVAILIAGCAHTASAQTADEVVEKSIAATGGRAAFAKLRSRKASGTITLMTPAGDVEGTIEVLSAAPNKVRTLIKADLTSLGAGPFTLDQRFDGSAGYAMDSLQGNRDITGNQLDILRNNSFPNVLLNYKQLGMAAKLVGKEKVGDRDAYQIAFEPTTGSVVRQYFDAETYLPVKVMVKVDVPQLGQEIEQTTMLLDLRDVDGVKFAFRAEATSAVQSYTIVFTKVEHNVTIDEALFVKPKP